MRYFLLVFILLIAACGTVTVQPKCDAPDPNHIFGAPNPTTCQPQKEPDYNKESCDRCKNFGLRPEACGCVETK